MPPPPRTPGRAVGTLGAAVLLAATLAACATDSPAASVDPVVLVDDREVLRGPDDGAEPVAPRAVAPAGTPEPTVGRDEDEPAPTPDVDVDPPAPTPHDERDDDPTTDPDDPESDESDDEESDDEESEESEESDDDGDDDD